MNGFTRVIGLKTTSSMGGGVSERAILYIQATVLSSKSAHRRRIADVSIPPDLEGPIAISEFPAPSTGFCRGNQFTAMNWTDGCVRAPASRGLEVDPTLQHSSPNAGSHLTNCVMLGLRLLFHILVGFWFGSRFINLEPNTSGIFELLYGPDEYVLVGICKRLGS